MRPMPINPWKILEIPQLFSTWIDLLGARACNARLVSAYIDPRPGQVVLDIGCGVGNMLDVLPEGVRYVGFDLNAKYVDFARRHHRGRGEFRVGDVNAAADAIASLGVTRADAVILFGILHHIDDTQARALLAAISGVLKPGGVLLTLDPCIRADNKSFVRLLIASDRGRHVRDEAGYMAVAAAFDGTVRPMLFHHLIRIPYTHIVLRAVRA